MSIFKIFSKDHLLIKSGKVFNEGVLLFKDKNYSGAINKYLESLRLIEKTDIDQSEKNNMIANVLHVMSQARVKMAQFELAQQELERAISLNPNDESLYWGLGSLKLDQKQFEQAITWFEKMIVLNPSNVGGYFWKGICLTELKRYQEAIPYLEKALKIGTKLKDKVEIADALIALGDAYEGLNEFIRAIEYYDRSISIDNKNSAAYVNRGNCKIELGQKEEGCRDYHRALELGDAIVQENIDEYCK